MRSRLAKVLSVGAAVATASAVGVTSHISGGPSVGASASSSTDGTSTPGTGSSASTAAGSAPATGAPVSVAAVPVQGSQTQFSYLLGDAATVVLDSANASLRIVTFAPHPGWFTVSLEQPSTTQLVVRLQSTSGEARFTANVVNGAIVAELQTGGPSGTQPGVSAPEISGPAGTGPDSSGVSTSDASTSAPSTSDASTSSSDANTSTSDASTSSTSPDDGDGDNSGPGGGGGDDNSGPGS